MCQHQPRCQGWPAPDRLAARIVADRRLASPGVLVRPMLYLTKIGTLPAKGVALGVMSTGSPEEPAAPPGGARPGKFHPDSTFG